MDMEAKHSYSFTIIITLNCRDSLYSQLHAYGLIMILSAAGTLLLLSAAGTHYTLSCMDSL